jgi:uncharacterized protein with PhoU and TrkA domain
MNNYTSKELRARDLSLRFSQEELAEWVTNLETERDKLEATISKLQLEIVRAKME